MRFSWFLVGMLVTAVVSAVAGTAAGFSVGRIVVFLFAALVLMQLVYLVFIAFFAASLRAEKRVVSEPRPGDEEESSQSIG